MNIVCPTKIALHGEMTQNDVLGMHVETGLALPRVFKQYARENLGINLSILSSARGWYCGFSHRHPSISDWMNGLAKESVAPIVNDLSGLIASMEAAKSRSVSKQSLLGFRQSLQTIVQALSQSQWDIARTTAIGLLRNAVFGVNSGAVATALICREIQPDVDVFLTAEEFAATYTAQDWDYLCDAFEVFIPTEAWSDPNQLMLFEQAAFESNQRSGGVMNEIFHRIRSVGPSALAMPAEVLTAS